MSGRVLSPRFLIFSVGVSDLIFGKRMPKTTTRRQGLQGGTGREEEE
jgi:hypothetical protein